MKWILLRVNLKEILDKYTYKYRWITWRKNSNLRKGNRYWCLLWRIDHPRRSRSRLSRFKMRVMHLKENVLHHAILSVNCMLCLNMLWVCFEEGVIEKFSGSRKFRKHNWFEDNRDHAIVPAARVDKANNNIDSLQIIWIQPVGQKINYTARKCAKVLQSAHSMPLRTEDIWDGLWKPAFC